MADPPKHDGIAAATLYNGPSRKLVRAFKHGNRIALAPMMARLMTAKLDIAGPEWLVVPVPLHRWRLWKRSYNQAAVLAGEISGTLSGTLAVDALLRRKHTPSLGGMGAGARTRALTGAITVNPKWADRLRDARIVLVDDVLTSGATSNACVSVLKRAKADTVIVSCFARVLDEALPHV